MRTNTGFGSGGSSSRVPTTLAEINVTPFVDVMLVLLIIFMISAPLMEQGLQVNLPKASGDALSHVPDQMELTITAQKTLLLADDPIKEGLLQKKLTALTSAKPELQIFIRADAGVDYGYVAHILSLLRQAKITQVGLVTEPAPPKKSGKSHP